MLEVIDLFREKETRDELGIGVVRDAFADMFFPGTSTIQTRARYFLFIPWIYRGLERKKVGSTHIAAEARKKEVALTKAIVGSKDSRGVFGRQAGASLKRLPSSVYWQGLGTWGIRVFPGSQDQYHRSLGSFYEHNKRSERTDDGDPVDGGPLRNWHAGLPPEPVGFLEGTSFELSRREAEYLSERIMASAPDTLLALLIDQQYELGPSDFPWEHPRFGEFPTRLQVRLWHARNFSEAIHGAALLYNLMLSEARGIEELEEWYRGQLAAWASDLEDLHRDLMDWERSEFWEIVASEGARVAPPARLFMDAWLDMALVPEKAAGIADDEDARRLIRELTLKRGLARLHNQSALELWGGAAGAAQLGYRWGDARVIITDILEGLRR
jgi:hypothetical protein